MKTKSLIAAILGLSVGIAFAETGLEGGRDGLHQQSAKTLGQWGISVGIGAEGVADAQPSAYDYYYYSNGQATMVNSLMPSISGNFHAAVGLLDFLDLGVVVPIHYDDINPDDEDAELNGWGLGDIQLWTKFRLPMFDTTDLVNVAVLGQIYFPTGDKKAGMRPRHVWYVNAWGEDHAFTADDWALEASLLLTLDFNRLGIPLRWNSNIGFVGVFNEGANTMLYGTGLNFTGIEAMDIFLEYSGEMRVEKTNSSHWRDPLSDPMRITPGVRFHLAKGVDLAVGADIGITAFIDEDKLTEKYVSVDKHQGGKVVRYKIGAADYGASALLTWRGNPFAKDNDEDNDGVEDKKDQCAHTPSGVNVDANGCPMDEDKDGIPDYLDKCAGTPAGTAVDSIGCPVKNPVDSARADSLAKALAAADSAKNAPIDTAAICAARVDTTDTDKDGVYDANDKCPNTPKGAVVDSTGCPLDSDKDNVYDGLDKCPNTLSGVMVDSTGCPLDSDKDGVADFHDKCPNTPKGAVVDSTGCILDSDKDGVIDAIDQCPNTLHGVEVDKVGCPVRKKEDLSQLRKGIAFQLNSAKLTKKSFGTLDDVANLMKKYEQAKIEVQGHTDESGSAEHNQKLSEDRAKSVANYIIKKGVSEDRIRAVGYGNTRPIADNKTKKGRKANRRVELVPFE